MSQDGPPSIPLPSALQLVQFATFMVPLSASVILTAIVDVPAACMTEPVAKMAIKVTTRI